jgi:hypothetical protein
MPGSRPRARSARQDRDADERCAADHLVSDPAGELQPTIEAVAPSLGDGEVTVEVTGLVSDPADVSEQPKGGPSSRSATAKIPPAAAIDASTLTSTPATGKAKPVTLDTSRSAAG